MARPEEVRVGEPRKEDRQGPMRITSGLLARNTLLNLVSQAVPLVAGVVCLPFIVRGLGIERYGLLSLTWAILGYSFIFDLGLGRATTKFVAEALGKNDTIQIPRLVWTTILIQGVLGGIGSVVLVGSIPLLVGRLLNVPLELIPEAKAALYLLALALPVTMIFYSVSGVLQAAQRFDLLNAVGVPLAIMTPVLTLIGALVGLPLAGIVGLILSAKLAGLLISIVLVLRLLPSLRRPSVSFALFPRLFAFGGWITVSSIVAPILEYLDRFFLASILSMSAVGYYTAPYSAVTKLSIIPSSLVLTLFPAFSTLGATTDQQSLRMLFARSIKYSFLAMGPIAIILFLFAQEGLRVWLGGDFAAESTVAARVLIVGVVINALASVPFALLQGVGRPDITAKFHLIETPLYVVTIWYFISHWGIAGAASAWALRVTVDALLLFTAAFKICRFPLRLPAENGLPLAFLACSFLAGAAWGLKFLMQSLPLFVQIVGAASLLGSFAWFVWARVLDPLDRVTLLKGVRFR